VHPVTDNSQHQDQHLHLHQHQVVPGPYDVSTNGTISGAAAISLNTDVKGTIAPKNDIDHYQFTISTGGSITVWLTTLPGNYDLAVLNSSGTQIGISKNKGTRNESISLSVAPGIYYAKVFPAGTANSATSCYTLKVQTVTATRATALVTLLHYGKCESKLYN
jgi:hypothetical protein